MTGKKLTHLKTLKTVVEYQTHVECRHDGMHFENALCYLGNLIHTELSAVVQFVFCYCILYAFCMLAWCVF